MLFQMKPQLTFAATVRTGVVAARPHHGHQYLFVFVGHRNALAIAFRQKHADQRGRNFGLDPVLAKPPKTPIRTGNS